MTRHPRERVTIDLRGIGPRLHAHAAARGKTAASVVRAAVVATLAAEGAPEEPGIGVEPVDARAVKVTVRLGVWHAVRLARCARKAGVSQGTYLAGLLDGVPPSPRLIDPGGAPSKILRISVRSIPSIRRATRRLIEAPPRAPRPHRFVDPDI